MKKIISVISFVLVLVMLASGATVFGFSDFKGEWRDGIFYKYYSQYGWEGYPDGTFKPDKLISRSEFVCYLYKFRKSMEYVENVDHGPVRKYNNTFSDVSPKSWYYKYVVWAYEYGFINGVGGGKFAPDSTITVFEYAIVLKRFYDTFLSREFWDYYLESDLDLFMYNLGHNYENYNYSYSYLRDEIMENAVLVDPPRWFAREASIEDILKLDIWIGGGGNNVDMNQFSATRGEIYIHSHEFNIYSRPNS